MSKKNVKKAPELRFKGFSDDWERCKLADLVTIKSGWSPSNFINGTSMYVKVDDLNHSSREQNDSQMKVQDNSKYRKIKIGSVIFPKRGAAIMTNKVRILAKECYMDTNMMALEPDDINEDFLFMFIYRTGLYKIADTSTIPQINNKHIESYKILIPSILEQQKIGVLFRELDDTITLHQRKLEQLSLLKQAYLQMMFIQEKQSEPKLRIADLNTKWVQRKFTDIVSRINSTSEDGSLPRIEYEDIISGSGKLNKDVFQKGSAKKGIEFDENDVLFGKLRPYLQNWLFPNFKGIAVGDFWVFRALNTSPAFIYSLIQSDKFQTVSNLSTGTKMPRSDWPTVSNTNFYIPQSISEQKKIGKVFKCLDDTINLHQQKLEKLQTLKKAYLQKMFI